MERMQKMEVPRKPKDITTLERQQLERTQEVLAMRNVLRQAETLHARDNQLKEKEKKQSYERDYEYRMHHMMEDDRIAAMQRLMKKEEMEREKGRERAIVIDRQLQDRQEQRLRSADEVEFQKEEFRMMCEAREKEEEKKKQEKAVVARVRREELVKANKMAMNMKLKRQGIERQADLNIVEYQKRKAWDEEKREEEKQRIRQAKDAEFSKMLLAQERIVDSRSQQDEDRMMAAFRVKEKAHRIKTQKTKEEKARGITELKQGWEDQKRQKALLLSRQAEQDRWETTAQELSALAIQERLDAEAERNQIAAYTNNDLLTAQREARDAARQKTRQTYLEIEHGQVDKQHKAQDAKVDKIRQESINQMKKMGVPKKYWHKLEDTRLGQARLIMPCDDVW